MALNYKLLAKAAKAAVDKRGGTEALKQDLEALQQIAKGQGSVGTKAGKAVSALKTPANRQPQPGADAEADGSAPRE